MYACATKGVFTTGYKMSLPWNIFVTVSQGQKTVLPIKSVAKYLDNSESNT